MEGISSPMVSIGSDDIVRDQAVDERDVFQCHICMDQPTNSVLTSCGHLFCWSCLYGWLQNRVRPCPVCKILLEKRSIIPLYGCQREIISRVDCSIPPRPSAPLLVARQQSAGSAAAANVGDVSMESNFAAALRQDLGSTVTVSIAWLQATLAAQTHTESLLRDLRMETLRSRAQADFQAIRASNPPSSTGWIAEASDQFAREFDPSASSGDAINDLHVFVFGILVIQGEHFPGVNDFRRSWLPYYEAWNPELAEYDHYNDFLEAWARHFHEAWDRAGRPGFSANATQAPAESLLRSSSSSQGARHEESSSDSESEVEEIDATEYERSLQQRREFRRIQRESRRANLRRRPY